MLSEQFSASSNNICKVRIRSILFRATASLAVGKNVAGDVLMLPELM